ncbi:MAG TPA: hypothetical protein P5556_07155 [Candidatus Gastranaerophilales bacterium]|nr:hypothetical protein [Candidatus Gastranaerophilales bacterium]
MKKLILTIALIMSISQPASASEEMADDWGSIDDNYNQANYEQIVSDKDYENALNALKGLQKPNKKLEKKLKEKGLNLNKEESEKRFALEVPVRSEPLFTLPINVNHNGALIDQGFYLAKVIKINSKYFIRLTKGEGRIIADIEANVFQTGNINKNSEIPEKIFSEIIDNERLKVTYSGTDVILEAYLWIQQGNF